MPIIKSAKKRVKVSNKAATRNSKTKRVLRDAVKSFKAALSSGKSADIEKAHKQVNSAIDTAAKKNVMHKNKAARKKSQISKELKSAGVKSTAKAKPVTKKAPVKKPVAKKVATKKPVTKKATK
jgi:small subunit ribosomal protein S20